MNICIVVGTRPQFIKYSIIQPALSDLKLNTFCVNTGQHYSPSLSSEICKELSVKPFDLNLNLGSGHWNDRISEGVFELLKKIKGINFDAFLVIGDSNPAVIGAMVAFYLKIPSIHCESGLRSYEKSPEETNRIMVDRLSSLHFCSHDTHKKNVITEEGNNEPVVTGDLLVDVHDRYGSLYKKIRNFNIRIREGDNILTIHRRGNLENLELLTNLINKIIECSKGRLIWPVHPGALSAAEKIKNYLAKDSSRLILIPALSYLELNWLKNEIGEKRGIIITDSVGLQVEAYLRKIPSLAIRNSTEHSFLQDYGASYLLSLFDYDRNDIKSKIYQLIELDWSAVPDNLFGCPGVSHRMASITADFVESNAASYPFA